MTDMLDRVAVITGGSAGIGRATARELTRRGAHVILIGRGQEALAAVVSELGARATAIVGDVTSSQDLARAFDSIRESHGRIDILVANAGGGGHSSLGSMTDDSLDSAFDLNVRSVMHSVQNALPMMPPGSCVVVTGSVAASHPSPSLSLYSGAKAAIRSMVRAWAVEAKDGRVRMNVVSPGAVDTDALRGGVAHMAGAANVQAQLDAMGEASPNGRIAQPEDIAATIAFLASDAAAHINGVEIIVDGGAHLL